VIPDKRANPPRRRCRPHWSALFALALSSACASGVDEGRSPEDVEDVSLAESLLSAKQWELLGGSITSAPAIA
jgi:hypothetical protein